MKRLKPFSIVLVGVLALLAILFMTTKKNDYTSTLQKYAALIQAGASGDLCLKFPCCDIHKDIYGCSLRNMPKLPSTLVFPGGETRCIFSSSTPYSFQVWPGDSDRVLLNFQGGGLCWDKLSTSLQFCSTNTSPQTLEGVFDRQNKSNKFANYTIINIMYCSGDMFIGDVERDYSDPDGNPVVQKVLLNVDIGFSFHSISRTRSKQYFLLRRGMPTHWLFSNGFENSSAPVTLIKSSPV